MSSNEELDPEEVEQEEDLIFGYGSHDRKPTELISDYLPEKEDYGAKTVLTHEQVHLLAGLEQLTAFYPELSQYDRLITQWIASYEKRMTSVNGLSRSDFLQILVAVSGGSVNESEAKGILDKVLDANIDGEDNE